MPSQISDEALVLKTQKLGESDRIITLLTRNNGKLRAVAKGVRKTSSKIGGANETFMRINSTITLGKNLDIIAQSVVIKAYGKNICQDYDKYLAAGSIIKTVDKLVSELYIPSEQLFLLTVRALNMLSEKLPPDISPNMVNLSYMLRALSIAGFELDLEMICDPKEEEQIMFDALFEGDWKTVASLARIDKAIEENLTKIIASAAVQYL